MEDIELWKTAVTAGLETSDEINNIYGPIVLLLVWMQVIGTIMVTVILAATIHGYPFRQKIFSGLLHLLDLLILTITCDNGIPELRITAERVSESKLNDDEEDVRQELEIFSLQLLHHSVEFTACGFFQIDLALMYEVISVMSAYGIISVQFFENMYNSHPNRMCPSNCVE